jgi:putative transcriptional regulator
VTPINVNLRRFRDAAGLTQMQLSERAGVRQATISDLETGNAERIAFSTIEKLCRALSIKPGDLLELSR